jgi:hypothetical protein
VSVTVTVNVHVSDPHTFDAIEVTVVVPRGKLVPDTGEYVIAGAGLPVAVAALPPAKKTMVLHAPGSLPTLIFAGHVTSGLVLTVRSASVDVAEPQRFENTER